MRGATSPRLQLELICARVLLPAGVRRRASVRPGSTGWSGARPSRAPARVPLAVAGAGPRPCLGSTGARRRPVVAGLGGSALRRPCGLPASGWPARGSGAAARRLPAAPRPRDGGRLRPPERPAAAGASGVPVAAARSLGPAGAPRAAGGAAARRLAGRSGRAGRRSVPGASPGLAASERGVASAAGFVAAGSLAPSAPGAEPPPRADRLRGAPPRARAAPDTAQGAAQVRQMWPQILEAVKNRRRFTWILLSQNAQVVRLRRHDPPARLLQRGRARQLRQRRQRGRAAAGAQRRVRRAVEDRGDRRPVRRRGSARAGRAVGRRCGPGGPGGSGGFGGGGGAAGRRPRSGAAPVGARWPGGQAAARAGGRAARPAQPAAPRVRPARPHARRRRAAAAGRAERPGRARAAARTAPRVPGGPQPPAASRRSRTTCRPRTTPISTSRRSPATT